MTTPTTNFSGVNRPHKKPDIPQNSPERTTVSNRQSSHGHQQEARTSAKNNNDKKKGDEKFRSIYEGNFHAGNLDYINDLLLQNKTSSSKDKAAKEAARKKGHNRAKSSLADSSQPKPTITINKQEMSNNMQSNRRIIGLDNEGEENEGEIIRPPSMRPDEERDFQRVEVKSRPLTREHMEVRYDKEEFYGGNDTHRNMDNLDMTAPTQKEEKLFEKYFKNDGMVRRSMSLEDLRIDKKIFEGNHNKSTMHNNPPDLGGDSIDKSPDRSGYHEFKQSHSSPKGGFLSNLKTYIDYFSKSENVSYRNMKAGQYFRGNVGKSHRTMQKELDMMTQELNMTKLQMQKVKWTLNKVLEENKILTKEMKVIHAQEREKQQLFQEMQDEIIKLRQKNHQYKAKCAQFNEMFKQERIENEHNLRSLKQVLANSINIALEHKSSPYKKEKKAQLRHLLGENLFSKKDRENISHGQHYTREKRRLNGTIDALGSIYETGNHRRSIDNKDSSMLLSPKESFTSNEGQEGEFSQQFSNSNEIENIYESQFQDPQQASYRHAISKEQQIKFLREKLTELMHSDDISFSGQTTCAKTSTKTSRGQHPRHKKNISEMEVPGYYLSKDRQSIYKQASGLARHSPQEQRSRIMHHGYEGAPFLNDVTEGSFSST